MDSFGDLIPLLLGAGYLALRFLGAKRKSDARRGRPASPAPRRKAGAPSVFEQLAARLEEQANETRRAAEARAAERAVPAPPPRRTRVAGAARRAEAPRLGASAQTRLGSRSTPTEAKGYFDKSESFAAETEGYAHERHGFGPENPLSEEAFEQASDLDLRAPRIRAFDPHGLASSPEPTRPNPLLPPLRTTAALRDAFVLQTILTRPAALRHASARPDSDRP